MRSRRKKKTAKMLYPSPIADRLRANDHLVTHFDLFILSSIGTRVKSHTLTNIPIKWKYEDLLSLAKEAIKILPITEITHMITKTIAEYHAPSTGNTIVRRRGGMMRIIIIIIIFFIGVFSLF